MARKAAMATEARASPASSAFTKYRRACMLSRARDNMHYLERRIIRRIHEGRGECSGGVLRCGSAPPDNAVRSKRVLVRSTCSCRRRSTGIGSSRSGARVGAAAARWSSTCRRRAGSWSTVGAGDEILSRTSRETGSVALRVSILDVVARVAIRRGPRASQLVRCPAR
jgi:hypothetical protein